MSTDTGPTFRTATIKRGDLIPTISATGTLEPEEVVDVGAQIVGRVKELGTDPSDPEKQKRIDYNSIVHEGTVLACIDDAVYRAQLEQAQASLLRAKADLLQMEAKLNQCKREADRAETLRPKKAISDTDYDLAIANYLTAKANLAVGEAVVRQGEASLRLAQTNLDYTIIRSPVEGVIIDRRVNVGQTVVSSLNAPSLFLIAKDLRRMQVWASVNEADIGRLTPGMPVRFTVDTFPGETFRGTVQQIRMNAQMTQNVVTFTVVVTTDNANRKLRPYLTANLQFEIDNRPNVLLAPNGALRWKPRAELIAPDTRDSREGASEDKAANGSRRGGEKSSGKQAAGRSSKHRVEKGQVWVADGRYVRPIEVQIGLSDGSMTEISGSDLKEDMEVVIGEVTAAEQTSNLTNPFTPKLPGRGMRSRM
jgi:HlyD family secretion protein